MKRKIDKFDYMYSKILGQEFAVEKKTGKVFFRDGVRYSAKEIEKLRGCSASTIIKTHNLKKIQPGNRVK